MVALLVLSYLLFTISMVASSSSPLSSSEHSFQQCLNNEISHPSSFPIDGALYFPKNSSFLSVLRAYVRNLRFATPQTPKPVAIVTAMHESHVQATVICTRCHGWQLRIRSGGHNYEGLSYVADVPFVLLDMNLLRCIEIDVENKTAYIQAGVLTGELYYSIAEKSNTLAFPAGVCTDLGVAAHTSGCGYGFLMRKYGLTCDNVVDAQIVDVYGRLLDRKSMGENLFWAIRGGGGASFGVIVSWTINLVPVPEKLTVFTVDRTLGEGATNLVYKWQNIAPGIDRNLFIRIWISATNVTGSRPRKTVTVSFIAVYLGNPKALLKIMKREFNELGLKLKDCISMRWIEAVLYWFYGPNAKDIKLMLNRNETVFSLKRKSDYLTTPIQKAGLIEIWKEVITLGSVVMDWNPYGGRMSVIARNATAFPNRDGIIALIQYARTWTETGEEVSEHNIDLMRQIFAFMTPYVSSNPRRAFLNYLDLDIGSNSDNYTDYDIAKVYGDKYFGSNFDRLVEIKTDVDPENFFRNKQSIPTLATQDYRKLTE